MGIGRAILITFVLLAATVACWQFYIDNFAPKAVFRVRIHYLNGEQVDYNITASAWEQGKLTDGNRGYGAAKTVFEFGTTTINNVCRYEILSLDTIKKVVPIHLNHDETDEESF